MLKLSERISLKLTYPILHFLLSTQSAVRGFQAIGKKPTVFWQNSYQGEKIALIALYQKGKLRPDTRNLMETLKSLGVFIIAVNTLKLDDAEDLKGVVDCYVEKTNFGRDFGSYKCGFEHIFSNHWDENCPRILMMNDSVYCSSRGIGGFLSSLMLTDFEVLGATENHEIEHHLGSFCISISGKILRDARFQRYWKEYKNSDVRPRVIRRGEQKLSKLLKRCISAPSEFRTLFGADAFIRKLEENPGFVDDAIHNSRRSTLTGWKRFSGREVVKKIRKDLLRTTSFPAEVSLHIDEMILKNRIPAVDLDSINKILQSDLRQGVDLDPDYVRNIVVSELADVYQSGSQIHQNAAILLQMGSPIIKLDGYYRGMFSLRDIHLIVSQLPPEEATELRRLLLDRPYGGDMLIGWKRAAFMRGLI